MQQIGALTHRRYEPLPLPENLLLTTDTLCPYSLQMADGLTVKQLAKRIAPSAEREEVERTIRQLRHWTASRALIPVGGVHTGPGRHRRYAEDQVYIGAVLAEMASYGLPIGMLWLVSMTLHSFLTPPSEHPKMAGLHEAHKLWNQAVAGHGRVYLRFCGKVGDDPEHISDGGIRLFDPEDVLAVPRDKASAFVVDLTKVFARLKA